MQNTQTQDFEPGFESSWCETKSNQGIGQIIYNYSVHRHTIKQAGSQFLLVVLVMLCLLSSLPPSYMKNLSFFPSLDKAFSANPMSAYESRFSGAKLLSTNESILGYIDQYSHNISYRDASRTEPYYLAQYAFAPISLEHNVISHRYVLGNFAAGFDYQEIATQRKLQVVRDFGNGVVLFQNRGK
jgi:hypothetical protein